MQNVLLVQFALNAALSIALVAYLLIRKFYSSTVRLLSLYFLWIAFWQFAFWRAETTQDALIAEMWTRIALICVAGVAAFSIHLISAFFSDSREKSFFLSGIHTLALASAVTAIMLSLTSSRMVIGGFLIFSFVSSLIFLFQQKPKPFLLGRENPLLALFLFASFIGVLCVIGEFSDALLILGNILVFLTFLYALYLTAPYQFFEVKMISLRGFRWIFQFVVSILPLLAVFFLTREWLSAQKNLFIAFALLILFYLFLAYLSLLQPVVGRFLGREELRKQKNTRSFFASISNLILLNDLFSRTKTYFHSTFSIRQMSLYLLNDRKQKCVLFGPQSGKLDATAKKEIILAYDHEFWEYWREDNRILSTKSSDLFGNAKIHRSFMGIAKELHADILFPLVFAGNFLGFFALSIDSAYANNHLEHIKLLEGIHDELSIAYSNSILFQQTSEWNTDLEKKIQERTKEAQELNEKLDKERNTAKMFNRLTIQRELEMIELKKKIRDLESGSQKAGA